jgi:hypothetical protein
MGVHDRNAPKPPADLNPTFVLISNGGLLHRPATYPADRTLCGHRWKHRLLPKNVPSSVICKRCA